ncbi:hypothetical protein VaNZ11_013405 [Volvox africanus]|uniref:Uncharacterized protein n=1 Tax=Volvox africanus TaxID=51714 RepID=A0ABQ5SG71_9CHLO|nr:hypothetical protein VaNZ11_013405 [Volvox africanus]
MEGHTERREKLECPGVTSIEQKLASLTRQRPNIGPAPRSSVLGKLATFLPQLASENERLQQQMQDRPAEEFDIEHVDGDEDGPYIEMDLACGILELRDEAALRAAERAMNGQEGAFHKGESSSSSSIDDSASDDTEEDGDDSDRGDEGEYASRDDEEMRPGAPKQGPMAEEADGDKNDDGVGQGLAEANGREHQRRAGVGRGATAAILNGRRKIAPKRSKIIEELS